MAGGGDNRLAAASAAAAALLAASLVLSLPAGASGQPLEEKLENCSADLELTCGEYLEVFSAFGGQRLITDVLRCYKYSRFVSPAEHLERAGVADPPPANINVTVNFRNVISLKTDLHVLTVDFELYLDWLDGRLALPVECRTEEGEDDGGELASFDLVERVRELLWSPPVELDGMVSMETVDSFRDGTGLVFLADGHLISYGRYRASVDCDLDFSNFPFDTQTCHFTLYLEVGDKSEVTLSWRIPVEEITNVDKLGIPDWEVDLATDTDGQYTFTNLEGDELDWIGAYFTLRRVASIHLMHTFFPSVMISLSSICSVFVPSDLVPGRMGLCITAFLSMISLFNGARKDWPLTTYMKAIDYWTGGCYFTVFTALIEYCLVLFLTKKAQWERKVRKHIKAQVRDKAEAAVEGGDLSLPEAPAKTFDEHGELIRKKEFGAARVELATRILLPGYFLLFNIIFWSATLASR